MAFWNWGQDLTGHNSGHWVSLVRLGSWDPLTDTPADSGLPRVAASFPRGALLSFLFSLSTCLVHCDLSTGPRRALEGLQIIHGRLSLPPGLGSGPLDGAVIELAVEKQPVWLLRNRLLESEAVGLWVRTIGTGSSVKPSSSHPATSIAG